MDSLNIISSFKYFHLFILFVLAFILLFDRVFNYMGFVLTILFSWVFIYFIFRDVSSNDNSKKNDPFTVVLLITMLSMFASHVIAMIKTTPLKMAYSKRKMPMKFGTYRDKKAFNDYSIVLVTLVINLFVAFGLFFIRYVDAANENIPYFSFKFMFGTSMLQNILNVLFVLSKWILAAGLIVNSVLALFYSSKLLKINTTNISFRKDDVGDKYKNTIFRGIESYWRDLMSQMTLTYMLGYRSDVA